MREKIEMSKHTTARPQADQNDKKKKTKCANNNVINFISVNMNNKNIIRTWALM